MIEKDWIRIRSGLEKATSLEDVAKIAVWTTLDCPVPPPSAYKQSVIREYASRFGIRTLVETGTWHGDTVAACLGDFEHIFSIELGEKLAQKAAKRFTKNANVSILQGDSTTVLADILAQLEAPAVFWLDAHYSEGDTAKGDLLTPIQAELAAILGHHINGHVILIDDMRCFVGKDDYPTPDQLRNQVLTLQPELDVAIEHDVMRITSSNVSA